MVSGVRGTSEVTHTIISILQMRTRAQRGRGLAQHNRSSEELFVVLGGGTGFGLDSSPHLVTDSLYDFEHVTPILMRSIHALGGCMDLKRCVVPGQRGSLSIDL